MNARVAAIALASVALALACDKTKNDSPSKDTASASAPAPKTIAQATPMISLLRAAKAADAKAFSRRVVVSVVREDDGWKLDER